jgi:hypothetical protein
VIDHLTVRVLTASSRTRVLTFVSEAGSVGGTIRVDDALGATSFVRVAEVFRQTRARSGATLLSAHRVRSAWRRGARSRTFFRYGIRLTRQALDERIANETDVTNAHWRVTDYAAFGVSTTRSRARISTLLADACEVAGAFGIADAFRSTVRRGANEFGQTRARRRISDLFALRVRSAW